MLELIAALVLIPVVFGLAMMLMGLAGFATYAPFILFDRILERLWGVRHPEATVVYTQPAPPPSVQQQPVVHHHYYMLGQQQPTPALPAPPVLSQVGQPPVTRPASPVTLDGEWRVVDPPVSGADEVQRLLGSGNRALARRR